MDLGESEQRAACGRARGWTAAGGDQAPGAGSQSALEALFAVRPEVWLRRIPGRETFAASGATAGSAAWGGEPAVLKRFTADNRRDRWFERLRRIDPRSPARREAENLVELARDGFPVPRALAWFEERGADGRSALAMQRVDHDETLAECLVRCDAPQRRAWLQRAAELVARLHGAGWYHRDLYCEHLILPTSGGTGETLMLLDLGRARRQSRPRTRWFVKDLAALQHSAPAALGGRERLRCFASYVALRGLERREARSLARAVLRKAERIARHAPRHVDPSSARSLPAS